MNHRDQEVDSALATLALGEYIIDRWGIQEQAVPIILRDLFAISRKIGGLSTFLFDVHNEGKAKEREFQMYMDISKKAHELGLIGGNYRDKNPERVWNYEI